MAILIRASGQCTRLEIKTRQFLVDVKAAAGMEWAEGVSIGPKRFMNQPVNYMFVDEEGTLRHRHVNPIASSLYGGMIVGDVVIGLMQNPGTDEESFT